MDGSRCIAYLTIEKKGGIDPSLRAPMGRHVFGCDICRGCLPVEPQAGCTIHRSGCTIHSAFFAEWVGVDAASSQSDQSPSSDRLSAMGARQFKLLFKGSPLQRTGRKRLLRNVAIAMGNSGECVFCPEPLEAWAAGGDPVRADAAEWARARLLA